MGKEINQLFCQALNSEDPYLEIKTKYNKLMLDLYPQLREMVRTAEDPFDTAMRLSIAGNVIDFGPQRKIAVMETIEKSMKTPLAIDDSTRLKKELNNAKTVMYIGDNCGEIVLDKLFLETIDHPDIYFVVRGGPVINDITMDDAKMVGIDNVAQLLTTGDNAPGAIWDTTSNEFKKQFIKSDVIISKGQGNYEGLNDLEYNIYYLLLTKCTLISQQIGVDEGSFLAMHNRLNTQEEAL